MRVLFIGDIVGGPGMAMVARAVPWLIGREAIDLVVANAENASGGAGLAPAAYRRLRHAGVDAVTMGDHIYKRGEIMQVMAAGEPICKPANFPPEAPGRDFVTVTARDGTPVAVFNLLGRLYMRPADSPFHAADRVLAAVPAGVKCVIVDMHAEATGDKAVVARYLDGRVSAVLGTHTHVPTADEQVLPGGTAFISDVGMTGPYDSILGRRVDRVLHTNVTFMPAPFDVATGDPRLAGAIVDIDAATGQAVDIHRIMIREADLPPAAPAG
jgi:hypothetical protein